MIRSILSPKIQQFWE